MTFKQPSGTSYVIGGGARNAEDKIMQFNGRGTVVVKHFFVSLSLWIWHPNSQFQQGTNKQRRLQPSEKS